jgi:translation initiation factor 2-alpha kinase 4
VYAARHKVDQQMYAIKKTVFKVSAKLTPRIKEEVHKMLLEARLFASINNRHIIRYNYSWVEAEDCSIEDDTPEVELTQEPLNNSIELQSPFIEFAASSNDESSEDVQESKDVRKPKSIIKIRLYIQMELCKETLEDYLNNHLTLIKEDNYSKALGIARQLIQAINAIHMEHSIIHRDLSLRNIFIANDGTVKVGDFGLATKYDKGTNTRLTCGLGTKTFASPEQITTSQYNQKADIYSLGLILLALFNPTETLSERYNMLHLCRKEGPSKDFMQNFPEIGELIKLMTNINPNVRPSIEELMALPLFQMEDNGLIKGSLGEVIVKVGEGKFKPKFAKLLNDNLLLYNKEADNKAKFCYDLKNCRVTMVELKVAQVDERSELREDQSKGDKSLYEVVIEHPQLKTLQILLSEAQITSGN